MKQNLTKDFSINKENRTITIKREFAASRPEVWDAFTKPEILEQWWAPKPWKVKLKKMDFREGGQWLYAMVGPKGEEHWSVANYKSIQPQKGYKADDAFTDSEGNINAAMPQSKWDVSFTGESDKTLVTFVISYSDVAQLDATIEMGFKEGITMTMEQLDELFAARKK
jgi:uncharacterized protein YndB with AHSA1/START domain